MESFARLVVWLFVTLLVLQLVMPGGGWSRMRAWLSSKFIGVQVAA